MTIKVIKKKTPPNDKILQGDCTNCRSTLQFTRKDVSWESSPKNESYYKFKCPVCKNAIYLDTNACKEIKS